MKSVWSELTFDLIGHATAFFLGCLFMIELNRVNGVKKTGKFCGQLSCSVLKEITLRPGTPVPIGDMDCKCYRWDEVEVDR